MIELIRILDLCFKNPSVENDIRGRDKVFLPIVASFLAWKEDIEGFLIPPQLELRQSEYDKIKAEKLGVIMARIKDLFCALKMKDCVLMKLLETISI